MIHRRPGRRAVRPALLAAAVVLGAACDNRESGGAPPGPAPVLPGSPGELEALLVEAVPSGLPRLPDGEVMPPAGEKRVEDVAAYADDPARERRVLRDEYGYRYGWERFWGVAEGAQTSVFLHQFRTPADAAAYARDLAANAAEHYGGILATDPPDLPDGCSLLAVDEERPEAGLLGPAAITWCGHGVFSVSVTAVADSAVAAQAEVRELLPEQLDRLPPPGG